MSDLRFVVAQSEEWLMERVLSYAKHAGYTRYTSTLLEAWRASIQGLSQCLLDALEIHGELLPQIGPDHDSVGDPIAAFGMLEAARHRRRGVGLGMFIGLMKLYRRSYVDLVSEELGQGQQKSWRATIDDFFDHVEIGICSQWDNVGASDEMAQLRVTNLAMTNEKNRYLTVFESLHSPAILLDHQNQISNLNHAAATALFGECTPGSHYYSEKVEVLLPWLAGELNDFASREVQTHQLQKRIETPAGERFFQVSLKRMLDVSEKFNGTVVLLEDVTERHHAEKMLEHLASTDPLTGSFNRRYFFERLDAEVSRARRYEHPMSLLMLDVDHFKRVNDIHGHAAGDTVLRLVVEVVKTSLRRSEIVGRLGGEEFAILLPETRAEAAVQVAERLRREVARQSCQIGGARISVTASIGVAGMDQQTTDGQLLLAEADRALYDAKHAGRNRVITATYPAVQT